MEDEKRLLFRFELFFTDTGLNEKSIDYSYLKSLGQSFDPLNPMDILARELQEE